MKRLFKITVTLLFSFLVIATIENNASEKSIKSITISSEVDIEEDNAKSSGELKIIKKRIKSIEDIESINNKLVKPIDYTNVLSFANLSIDQKKKKFIDFILPGILIAKYEYNKKLEKVEYISKKIKRTKAEQDYLDKMIKSFRAKNIDDLKKRLITHPTSIILAQASLESGWGTSRFFIKGRNLFGVWSFDPKEARMQTKGTRDGKHMYVKKYPNVLESIHDYLRTLARGSAYECFRELRAKTDDPFVIIKTLDTYCESGEKYVAKLDKQIRFNNFTKYDDYEIDPKYVE